MKRPMDDEETRPSASDPAAGEAQAVEAAQAQEHGLRSPGGRPVPLIDRVHRLMHFWKAGDVVKVDEYLDARGLRRHELFRRVLQSLIELAPAGSEERWLLESISNHVGAKGAKWEAPQAPLPLSAEE